MVISNTYIVVNVSLIDKLKSINEFELDLGKSLTSYDQIRTSKSKVHNFLPSDSIVQSHYTYFEQIIQKLGNLGSLLIYSNNDIMNNQIIICNDGVQNMYIINMSKNIYEELNRCMNLFFRNVNVTKDNANVTEQVKEYVNEDANEDLDINVIRPVITPKKDLALLEKYNKIKNKPLSELTEEERIIYARCKD